MFLAEGSSELLRREMGSAERLPGRRGRVMTIDCAVSRAAIRTENKFKSLKTIRIIWAVVKRLVEGPAWWRGLKF